MPRYYKFGTIAVALFIVSGCTHHKVAIKEGFGNSVATNMAKHVANPAPEYDGPAQSSGARAALAMERYKTDMTEKLIEQRTTEVGSSGGGGG